MPEWEPDQPGACCDDFSPRITGSQRESETEVMVYSLCMGCDTRWRDVFVYNRAERALTPDDADEVRTDRDTDDD